MGNCNRSNPDGLSGGELQKENLKAGFLNVLGSYLGECVIVCYGRAWNGQWFVALDNKKEVFPFAKVQKQMENGLEDGIGAFFKTIPVLFKDKLNAQRAPLRKPWW